MDQNVLDSIDDKSFDEDWEHAEDELIHIENPNLSDEVGEVETQTPEQLAADEAHLEENVEQMPALENASVIEQVNLPNDQNGLSSDKPANGDQDNQVYIGTELGLAHYIEGGRVEAPERKKYNDIIETEDEVHGHPEQLG